MSNLEFIEILIEENKKEIELIKNMIAEDDKYPSIKKINERNLKSVEELLTYLEQIKTELEAWEVVKPSISEEHLEDCQIRTMYGENTFMNVSQEKANKVIKALGVKDE